MNMLTHTIRFVNMSYNQIVRISGSCESKPWYVRHQCSGFGEAVGRVDQTIMMF